MSVLFGLFHAAILLAVLPFALDWRSPALSAVRPWALCALIAGPLALAAVDMSWRGRRRDASRITRALWLTTLALTALVVGSTIALEARFQWVRHAVLRADPHRLEKLGRHVIVGYRDRAELHMLVERGAVAGVFLAAHNVRQRSTDEVSRELAALQAVRAARGLPSLLIASDQEGGTVSRLSPPLARPASLAELTLRYSDPAERRAAIRQSAAQQGRELARLGVNVNFAPVVDVDHGVSNPDDRFTHIRERAISSDARVVADVAGHYCSGLWDAGVRCTLKHFPGLGRVFEDTHRQGADLAASRGELEQTDWVPFRALMQRNGTLTMLAHVRLPALDARHPASFSHPLVAGLLRQEWRHDGILVTDDFCMAAVYDSPQGIGTAAVEALNAGVDLILVSFDGDQYYPVMYALLQAERDRTLRQNALARSDERLRRAEPGNSAALGPRAVRGLPH